MSLRGKVKVAAAKTKIYPMAVATVALASAPEAKEGGTRPWRPDDEYDSQLLLDVISPRRTPPSGGKDGQRFAHLHSISHIYIGREEFVKGITAFWRKSLTILNRSR